MELLGIDTLAATCITSTVEAVFAVKGVVVLLSSSHRCRAHFHTSSIQLVQQTLARIDKEAAVHSRRMTKEG